MGFAALACLLPRPLYRATDPPASTFLRPARPLRPPQRAQPLPPPAPPTADPPGPPRSAHPGAHPARGRSGPTPSVRPCPATHEVSCPWAACPRRAACGGNSSTHTSTPTPHSGQRPHPAAGSSPAPSTPSATAANPTSQRPSVNFSSRPPLAHSPYRLNLTNPSGSTAFTNRRRDSTAATVNSRCLPPWA